MPPGEGLGGGCCTPPNQKSGERSELIFSFASGRIFELSTGLACVLNVQCVLCVPRAITLCAASKGEKFRTKGEKFRTKGEKFRTKGEIKTD